jgi:hypothetical protein
MVLRGKHDRGIDQDSLVPSPPFGSVHLRHIAVGPFGMRFEPSPAEGIHSRGAGITFLKGGLLMQRRLSPRAVLLPACRHPACLPRAGRPEAGRRAPWDANMTSLMLWQP